MKLSLLSAAVVVGLFVMSYAADAPKVGTGFTIAPVKDGRYVPWRDSRNEGKYYAGEITTVVGTKFRCIYFTDVIRQEEIRPDYSGTLKSYADHIYLDHPGVAYPYRVTGFLHGAFVMTTWRNYEHWKKFGSMPEHGTLYLEK
ncbi:hypothetical protein [Horticoccus sp. 23ND18S-11]|uniref:hypothetical protein n=1 Tax=Horticoccus sp. 23ND18S-11 TaxID=3391832 RepID=UPI0039C8C864